ncbi:MAG: diiron oxygenase [Candidatus Binatia bacterium]
MASADFRPQSPVDGTRYFVPETFTPLFYTPLYAELTPEQRRRYNQLHGCYCNEQIMFFEKLVAERVLSGLLRTRLDPPLRARLYVFLEEERRHTRMFHELNRLCLPHWYEQKEFHFVITPSGLDAVLAWASRHPWFFPLFVWLMMLQEERAVFFGHETLRRKEELEPHFVAVQRAHLADEIEHVQWDQDILALIWSKATPRARHLSALLFRHVIGEFMMTPKRASLRVISALVGECPGLAPRLPRMRRALLNLKNDREWNLSLYSRKIVPKTFALFDRSPEFCSLSRVLRGYQPNRKPHG